MRRRLLPLLVLCAVVAACGGRAAAHADGPAADDVRLLAQHLRETHPDLFATVSRQRFETAVADAEARADSLGADGLLVELMRLAALPGDRNGHTGIFPFDPGHARELHAYLLRPYEFADGTYVIGQGGGSDLVGARLVAIAGHPLAEVEAAVRPLVPHDNSSSYAARVTQYVVVAEVLHGLGLVDAVAPVAFTFERGGTRFERVLAPVPAGEYTRLIGDLARPLSPPPGRAPAYLRRQATGLWTAALARGRVRYVAYNVTLVPTYAFAAKLLKLAKPRKVRGLVVDLRNNPGGDNTTYGPLLNALQRLARTKRIVVPISRTTFSAAENFATDLERVARPVFVGEPTGGSPNLYGDADSFDLPTSGLRLHVATIYWEKARPGDARIATEPQVPVPLTSADYFAGRDPVLQAALRVAAR
jgi:hypothetical protein